MTIAIVDHAPKPSASVDHTHEESRRSLNFQKGFGLSLAMSLASNGGH